jgi:hypothetical protein
MKLTENRLRAIIKEELKGVLGESNVIQFRPRISTTGTSVTGGGTIEPIGPHLDREREKKAIKNIGSETQIKDLAQALVRADTRGDTEAMNMIKSDAETSGIYDAVMELYRDKIKEKPKKEPRREYDPSLDLR